MFDIQKNNIYSEINRYKRMILLIICRVGLCITLFSYKKLNKVQDPINTNTKKFTVKKSYFFILKIKKHKTRKANARTDVEKYINDSSL